MTQLAARGSQPRDWEELEYFLRRLETVRFHENGGQEPYESRGSRTDLWGRGSETPLCYPTFALILIPKHPNILCPNFNLLYIEEYLWYSLKYCDLCIMHDLYHRCINLLCFNQKWSYGR